MTDRDRDTLICEAARRLLDADLERMPAAQRSRLRQARALALNKPKMPLRNRRFVYALSVCVLILSVVLGRILLRSEQLHGTPEMLEMVAAVEDLELYEDLEFYLWLDQLYDAG